MFDGHYPKMYKRRAEQRSWRKATRSHSILDTTSDSNINETSAESLHQSRFSDTTITEAFSDEGEGDVYAYEDEDVLNQTFQELDNIRTMLQEKAREIEERERHIKERERIVEQQIKENEVIMHDVELARQKMQEFEAELGEREILEENTQRAEAALSKLKAGYEQRISDLEQKHHQSLDLSEELKEQLDLKNKECKKYKKQWTDLRASNDLIRSKATQLQAQTTQLQAQVKALEERLLKQQRAFDVRVRTMQQEADQRVQEAERHVQTWEAECRKYELQAKGVSANQAPKDLNRMYDTMVALLEWLADRRGNTVCESAKGGSVTNSLVKVESCIKTFPLLVDLLRPLSVHAEQSQAPCLELLLACIAALDDVDKRSAFSATYRRLGHVVYVSKESRPPILLASGDVRVRVLSCLAVLKTLTQADVLAQVLQALCGDLTEDEAKRVFLSHQGVAAVSLLLRPSCRGTLSHVADVLLVMTADSGWVEDFLSQCNSDTWLRLVSVVMREPTVPVVEVKEKLSVVLHKLSAIKGTAKRFQACLLPHILDEILRTAGSDPSRSFLALNIRSTLHNIRAS
eukprot:Colp12_sorted_trinity150504_noHs@615